MEFIKSEGTDELAAALIAALNTALDSGKKVLWLVPGGSNISVVVRVMSGLNESNLKNLTLALSDERYGEPGHADSNFRQLHDQGLNERGATFTDILNSSTFEDTVVSSAALMEKLITSSDIIIGFLGMGPDGHIAGILPGSIATETNEKWVVGYDAKQFKRITLTPFALSHIQKAYVGAFGAEKRSALENLCTKASSIGEQPSRILCHLPEVSIFNDQIGDTK